MAKYFIIILMFAALFCGCTVSKNLERKHVAPSVSYTVKQEKPHTFDQHGPETSRLPDGPVLIPATLTDEGYRTGIVRIPHITVLSPYRTLAERNGLIRVDFVINVPTAVLGSARSVEITPILHRSGAARPLQSLVFRGGLFEKIGRRNRWQLDRFHALHDPDSLRAEWAEQRFVRFPQTDDSRIDSVIYSRESITFRYVEEIKLCGDDNKLQITIPGKVTGADGSVYRLPAVDTINFNISSLLSFVDDNPRYKQQVIEKYKTVTHRSYITFPLNGADVIDTLADNGKYLQAISDLAERIISDNEYIIDSILISSSCSPEGSSSHNKRLSELRALAFIHWLQEYFPELDGSVFRVNCNVTDREDFIGLVELSNFPDPEPIIDIIRNTVDTGKIDRRLQTECSDDYKFIREYLYPLLRSVDFQFNLRRPEMSKDTIRTNVPDMDYNNAIVLLRSRQYQNALNILNEYRDINTAIALLSLGNDQRAYEILNDLPGDYKRNYLMAVCLSRMGRIEDAKHFYGIALEHEPSMEFRADLDPELSNIIDNGKTD